MTNSSIEVGSKSLFVAPLASTQIMVDLGNVTFINTEISNKDNEVVNPSTDITAIKHARGKLNLLNGTVIDNFNTGIFKSADVYNKCSPRGLNIHNSTVKNTITAVHSTTQFVAAIHNFIKGNIKSEGLSYSNWFKNRIKKGIPSSSGMMSGHFTIQAPEVTYLLSENLFDYIGLDFYHNNLNSTSICNTWVNMDEGYAVVGELLNGSIVDFPDSWGTDQQSAGNRHLDGENLLPKMFSEDPIINYFDPDEEEQELFDYEGSITDEESGEAPCVYGLYPPESTILFDSLFGTISINFTSLNQYWLYLDSLKTIKESLLSGSPLEKQKILQQEISQIEISKGDIVRNVLSNLTSTNESIESTWLSRADQGLIEYSELLALWYRRDYNKLDSIVSTLSDPDAETLLSAIEFVTMCSDRDLPLDSLPQSELDTLTEIAQLTFGNYSNIIRNYLNMVYDRPIFWPVVENGLIPRSSKYDRPTKNKKQELNFVINPNPSNGCFSISSIGYDWYPITYQIITSTGKIIGTGISTSTEPICINSNATGLHIVRIITGNGNHTETHKILIE